MDTPEGVSHRGPACPPDPSIPRLAGFRLRAPSSPDEGALCAKPGGPRGPVWRRSVATPPARPSSLSPGGRRGCLERKGVPPGATPLGETDDAIRSPSGKADRTQRVREVVWTYCPHARRLDVLRQYVDAISL